MAYTTIDDPGLFFNTVLYTGNSSTPRNITGVGFQPDFVWIKDRSSAYSPIGSDVVRGANKRLSSSEVDAEITDWVYGYTSAFISDGFTLTTGGTGPETVNDNGDTYVAWNWKAGTSGSGTTTGAGTGKAYSYSVNTTSGFSIVKYLGNGTAGHTIPHHLGAVPKMIIVKRDASTNWSTYHVGMGNGKSIPLNEGEAPTTSTTFWNDTTPTSSVFTVGSISNTNSNDSSVIAYCFAEKQGYSKIGNYTGGSDPFVYLGFKPAFVMFKNASAVENWRTVDNKRDVDNPVVQHLYPNSSAAEGSGASYNDFVDFLSNGFKIRSGSGEIDGSGNTIIYMAFAENPFVSSSGVPACAR